MNEESYYVEAMFVEGESSKIAVKVKEGDVIKNELWSLSKDVRPNMPLIIRRVQNIATGGEKRGEVGGYGSELVCCGVTMPIASVKNEAHAPFLLSGWIRELDKALAAHENGQVSSKPESPKNADEFARSILCSTIFKEKYKDTSAT